MQNFWPETLTSGTTSQPGGRGRGGLGGWGGGQLPERSLCACQPPTATSRQRASSLVPKRKLRLGGSTHLPSP